MIRAVYNNKAFEIQDEYNIQFSNNEVTFNDITIDFTGYTLADIPYKYQKIEIKEIENENDLENGKILFTGYLDDIKLSTMKNKKEERQLQLTLLSPLKMATVRTSSLIGTYEVEEAIKRVLQPLFDDGFTLKEINVDDGQITVNFVLETIENCMNSICSKRNIFWYINEKREILVNSIDYMFGKQPVKVINENDKLQETGLYNIEPTIENIDYANIINFKNVRLIYSEKNTNLEDPMAIENGYNIYPILNLNKKIKKGDVINFINPIIVDENILRQVKNENGDNENITYYSIYLNIKYNNEYKKYEIKIDDNNNYVKNGNITFSDDSNEEGEIVLQRDNFFSNLITGFKWNGEDSILEELQSSTALRYTTMKFLYTQEIEKLKGIISDSGQIEKTVDFQEKWTTLNQLINYGRSLIVQNTNTVNTVILEYDKNPNLEIGNIITIQAPNFYIEGNFAVNNISYTYINENDLKWKITLKNADLVSTYIDMFRPAEVEETENKIDTVILSEFVEENIKEIHTVSLTNENNHTLNFNL